VALPQQGLHVLRADRGRIYVALEGGHTGGGHGHPDRLAFTLQDGTSRILEDPGTGSYVDRTLHWYRSTLAHNAPLVDGSSQQRTEAVLRAFDQQAHAALVRVEANELAPGVSMEQQGCEAGVGKLPGRGGLSAGEPGYRVEHQPRAEVH
jgi:hypothetical protein